MAALPHPRFSCHPSRDATATTFAVGGDLDLFSVRFLRRLVEDAIAAGAARVVIDLRDVTLADLSALTYLIELRQRAQTGELELELMPASPNVMRLFDVTRTRELLSFGVAA